MSTKFYFVMKSWKPKVLNALHGLLADYGLSGLVSVGALFCLWIGLVTFGWARWGSVTIDSGREIYVAAALAEGKMLYRDVWYLYGPGAPYFNSLMFRIFGIHITVAYILGALSSLAVALTLFRCALYFISLPAAFTIGYVMLIQSFVPGIFTYPLPYSFASVYGSVAASLFLLYAILASFDPTKCNLFWASLWSAVALLTKMEFGFACFGALGLVQIGLLLRQRSSQAAFENLLAVTPALLVCAIVIGWMVSIGGVSFILQENFMSWPTSYFMTKYGQFWLRHTGFDLSAPELLKGLAQTIGFLAFWTGFRLWLAAVLRKFSLLTLCLLITVGAGAGAFWLVQPERFNAYMGKLLFPRQMVLIVGLATPVAYFLFWRSQWCARNLAILIVMSFGPVLAFRMLLRMRPEDYGIFYDGPVLLGFLILCMTIAIPGNIGRISIGGRRATMLLCVAICGWVTVQVYPHYFDMRNGRIPFKRERGMIYLPETMLPAWAEAADFMRAANRSGHAVMSIPEDTAMYFFAGVQCPIRVFAFTPGMLSPGYMTNKTIKEMEDVPVRYLIWSNRRFDEYGVSEFGVNFDEALGEYIRRNYRPVWEFSSAKQPHVWQATLWERNPTVSAIRPLTLNSKISLLQSWIIYSTRYFIN